MSGLRAALSLAWMERRPGHVFLAVAVIFMVAYLTAMTMLPRRGGRFVNGDTIQYYAYLRSLVIDHDLDFTNDYALLYATPGGAADPNNVWLSSTTPTGRRPNQMSIGPALLWSPFFLATLGAMALLRPFGVIVPLDGLAAPFPLSAGVAGIVYAAVGAWFCFRACRTLFPDHAAFWGTLVAWLASPALYYSAISPTYSHAPSMLASAAFCDVWLRRRGDDRSRTYVLLGCLAGIAALVRWQDAILVVLPAIALFVAAMDGRRTWVSLMRPLAIMGGAVLALMLPQVIAWQAIYGAPLVMPQGSGFMRWTSPAVFSVLFSLRHGLLSWTPALFVSVIGLFLLTRRDGLVGWSTVAVLVTAVYVNASVSDWWAGEAFGARRFVSDTVFFALGFAAFFAVDFWRARPVALRWTAVALIFYNGLFLLQYQLFMYGMRAVAPYPETVRQVLIDRITLPVRLLLYLWR